MSRRRGNDNENAFCEMAEELGYCAFPARGSRGVVDVICFADQHAEHDIMEARHRYVPLAVQVGTKTKPIASTLADLEAAPRPIGSRCIVARKVRVRAVSAKTGKKTNQMVIAWRFSTAGGTFGTLAEALA